MISIINKFKVALGEEKLGHVMEEERIIAKKLRAHLSVL